VAILTNPYFYPNTLVEYMIEKRNLAKAKLKRKKFIWPRDLLPPESVLGWFVGSLLHSLGKINRVKK
jgi:hypothetical protein